MTREEAIGKWIYPAIANMWNEKKCQEIIKALEQEPCDKCVYSTKDGYCQYDDITETIPPFEPCEDAISRQAAIDAIGKDILNYEGILTRLPPVNPQPKTGNWIEGQTDNPNIHNILCSRCFEGYPSKGHANSQYTREKYRWCPKCGAKMVEP